MHVCSVESRKSRLTNPNAGRVAIGCMTWNMRRIVSLFTIMPSCRKGTDSSWPRTSSAWTPRSRFRATGSAGPTRRQVKWSRGLGFPICRYTGYRGGPPRTGLKEIIYSISFALHMSLPLPGNRYIRNRPPGEPSPASPGSAHPIRRTAGHDDHAGQHEGLELGQSATRPPILGVAPREDSRTSTGRPGRADRAIHPRIP